MQSPSTEEHLFQGATHAGFYAKYRPDYPSELYEYIVGKVQEKVAGPLGIAIDVGCGSGLVTRGLAPYFEEVIGCDISEAQIIEARNLSHDPHVSYRVQGIDRLPADTGSVDLVTAAAALHWFDIPTFFEECRRILRPGGVVAAFFAERPKLDDPCDEITKQLNKEFNEFHDSLLWDDRRKIADEGKYRNELGILPFEEKWRCDSFVIRRDSVPVSVLTGFVQSWSGYQSFLKANPQSTKLDEFTARVNVSVSVPDTISLQHQVFGIFGRQDNA